MPTLPPEPTIEPTGSPTLPPPANTIPEPSSLLLSLSALAVLGLLFAASRRTAKPRE
ncbi:PEP-CTERM sorting domain-containing protein [Roseateles sp.]|uniref:PEP-CTERM sorting domain-containing protein n=1 Tax=Roseateles sp. TaxID=1971397 RepID=UPI00387E9ADB